MTPTIFPNGVSTTYDYDGMSRLKRLKDVSSTATLFDRQYAYNSASQIEQISEPTQTRSIGYDNVDRLTSMTNGTANESYTFDDVGNRTASHRSASYGYQSGQFNRVASTATANYNYDANGNMTTKAEGKELWRYIWDYENRLTTVSTRRQTVRYRYDALGRRVQRYIVGGKENTKFIYDGNDVLVDDNNGVLTKYQNGLGIDNKLKVSTNGTAKYFLTDHLGSTTGLADASGNITEQTSYDSFGNATNNLSTRYQFTGREFDNFTGLHYYRARWYDGNLGRFISEDPIGLSGGINQFGYVSNNASNLADPNGLDGCKKRPNGKCTPTININMDGGEPDRKKPWMISDPPPSPSPTPSVTPTPISPPPTSPTSPSEPMSPCECQTLRTPDFYSGGVYLPIPQTAGIVKLGGSVTIDRYGQIYLTPGVQVGFPGVDVSATAGYLVQKCKPHPSETENFLTSWGLNAGGGYIVVFGGAVSSGGRAIYGGFGSKGFGVTGGYGFRIY